MKITELILKNFGKFRRIEMNDESVVPLTLGRIGGIPKLI